MPLVVSKSHVFVYLTSRSAAFDTIDNFIFLDRLSKWLGLHGAVLNWVKSYLSNRLFRVKCSDQRSEPHHSSYGVPQGSVLRPLLASFKAHYNLVLLTYLLTMYLCIYELMNFVEASDVKEIYRKYCKKCLVCLHA